MAVTVVVGAQWGDEGKGKIIDLMAGHAQIVARFSGGNNAGHTVINSYGEFRLHIVPAGIFHQGVNCLIGNGVVIDPPILLEELRDLEKATVNTDHVYISDRAHLVLPYHRLLDSLEEERRGQTAIGTTRRGMGPVYEDKAARRGLRAGDFLLTPEIFREKLARALEYKNLLLERIYGSKPLDEESLFKEYWDYGQELKPQILQTEVFLADAISKNEFILLEGAQGTLLDLDLGTYPYVTSSNPGAAGAAVGTGIPPKKIQSVIGVFKSYCTRVGAGPMPTEDETDVGISIRERANEYGATTGRARRCGWFDGPMARLSNQINGFTSSILTRLDVLDELPIIPVCIAYQYRGEILQYPPPSTEQLLECVPVYKNLPGWQVPTSHIREYADLPTQAQDYVEQLQEIIDAPIDLISVGPRREENIVIHDWR